MTSSRSKPRRPRERVRVVGQLLHGQRVQAGAAGAPVAAVVVVDELEPVGQRVECRPQVRVVETQPAVHDQAGRPAAGDLVVQRRVVDRYRWHGLAPSRAPGTEKGA